ncbi:THUMP domain-containing class I SAM-dependent RNA methyltransferase [Candidatus Symbiobacter mobilis]|uniref:N6-adenine-specific DNA methyltransferase-like protein n=1 Tax=Candidatus Symbiobacter mobilis CR TaxID=946483 RepID=U5N4L3_9BURK|nr:THUMP domain-containing protein [Candidatus Symbiobacter mobilis]AGX86411.1 N6-adenine-specific DNA methyltransferase-like protein [Candidatus Symbiobacter mobilis CR]
MELHLFLPCPVGVEGLLAQEVARCIGRELPAEAAIRAGVSLRGSMRDVLRINLHSRLAQRVLIQLSRTPYRREQDIYEAAAAIAWEDWFTPAERFRVDITAQHCPLRSLHFAALRVKDAVCDRFRDKAGGVRPDVDPHQPDVRIAVHLDADTCFLYVDTSGEPLFKRGWRVEVGDAPLKETLAAAMVLATGWSATDARPLYDPCCGSGTIAIEAAQLACNIAPGLARRFAFERLRPVDVAAWQRLREEAMDARTLPRPGDEPRVYGSDVSHRMIDFAQRNARRAGVADALSLRGGDALERMPPMGAQAGVLLMNPPYGVRMGVGGQAGAQAGMQQRGGHRKPERQQDRHRDGRQQQQAQQQERWAPSAEDPPTLAAHEFFDRLATHWKKHYTGWSAWVLTSDKALHTMLRLRPSARIPLYNGAIECRLLRFDLHAGAAGGAIAATGAGYPKDSSL